MSWIWKRGLRIAVQWTIKDADMGGFVLHPSGSIAIPNRRETIRYLALKQDLSLPKLGHRVIEDKKKSNGLLRTIMLFQIT